MQCYHIIIMACNSHESCPPFIIKMLCRYVLHYFLEFASRHFVFLFKIFVVTHTAAAAIVQYLPQKHCLHDSCGIFVVGSPIFHVILIRVASFANLKFMSCLTSTVRTLFLSSSHLLVKCLWTFILLRRRSINVASLPVLLHFRVIMLMVEAATTFNARRERVWVCVCRGCQPPQN